MVVVLLSHCCVVRHDDGWQVLAGGWGRTGVNMLSAGLVSMLLVVGFRSAEGAWCYACATVFRSSDCRCFACCCCRPFPLSLPLMLSSQVGVGVTLFRRDSQQLGRVVLHAHALCPAVVGVALLLVLLLLLKLCLPPSSFLLVLRL